MKTGLLIATLFIVSIEASCPNKCNGHGTCGANDVCSCQSTWLGGDCSQRECPFVRAWVDVAQNANDAHYYAECGNRGSCDRSTGQCVCDPGYTGKGCRRMACPNSCSGHGTCEFIEEFAVDTHPRIGGASANTYAAWDQEKIVGCKCDPGWEGHDCSARMCPKGDDPLTTGQAEMKQIIKTDCITTMYLTYYDPYGESWTTAAINAVPGTAITNAGDGATFCSRVQTALRRLPNRALDTVTVAYSSAEPFVLARTAGSNVHTEGSGTTSSNGVIGNYYQCIVTFPSTPGTTGLQHSLGCTVTPHNVAGMQPITTGDSAYTCTVQELSSITSAGATTHKLTELAECSNRGTCDSSTGKCECFSGHKGTACEKQEALV